MLVGRMRMNFNIELLIQSAVKQGERDAKDNKPVDRLQVSKVTGVDYLRGYESVRGKGFEVIK